MRGKPCPPASQPHAQPSGPWQPPGQEEEKEEEEKEVEEKERRRRRIPVGMP